MRRSKRRRKPLGEDDVLRAVVCDYVGPAECAINAEAGYTTADASRAGLVARHTGPQREGAALPLPAESPAERTEVCVTFFISFVFSTRQPRPGGAAESYQATGRASTTD